MKLAFLKFAPFAVAVAALSTLSVGDRFRTVADTREVTVSSGVSGDETQVDGSGEQGSGGSRPGAVRGTGSKATSRLACAAGRNGGATDVGVTGSAIKLAATVVKSGVGESFLGEVPYALEAVKNKVNRAGGVCGRLLELRTVDDRWLADEGHRQIRTFISEGVFALAVSPSSEGLRAAIVSGDISRAGIPVVGADGMLISQYQDPWVWPVAASTISAMHVMALDATNEGAKTFGLVYDRNYHFGVEGASAFRGALGRLFPGQSVLLADVGIEAGQPSYKNKVDEFNRGCAPSCDFIAMLLEPPSALQWIKDGAKFGAMKTGGPQPLFVNSFARSCGTPCNGMWVWTGYKPPIPPFDSIPYVVKFRNDVKTYRSTTDVSNPFVQGGYLGMELLVEALEQVGPNLTRARLRSVLDSMSFDTGMTVPLSWRPGNHFANDSVHAFSVVINAGSFSGWRYEQTDWVPDPWVGLDAPPQG